MSLDDWKAQMKRGVLEYVVLLKIKQKSLYGYDLIAQLNDYTMISASESTIYPLLRRLTKAGYLTSHWKTSDYGLPPRKYYDLTEDGQTYLTHLSNSWDELTGTIHTLRSEENGNETQ